MTGGRVSLSNACIPGRCTEAQCALPLNFLCRPLCPRRCPLRMPRPTRRSAPKWPSLPSTFMARRATLRAWSCRCDPAPASAWPACLTHPDVARPCRPFTFPSPTPPRQVAALCDSATASPTRQARLHIHDSNVRHLGETLAAPTADHHGRFCVIDAPSVAVAAQLYQQRAEALLARGFVKVQVAVPRGFGSACLARVTRAALPAVDAAVTSFVRAIYSHARAQVGRRKEKSSAVYARTGRGALWPCARLTVLSTMLPAHGPGARQCHGAGPGPAFQRRGHPSSAAGCSCRTGARGALQLALVEKASSALNAAQHIFDPPAVYSRRWPL